MQMNEIITNNTKHNILPFLYVLQQQQQQKTNCIWAHRKYFFSQSRYFAFVETKPGSEPTSQHKPN